MLDDDTSIDLFKMMTFSVEVNFLFLSLFFFLRQSWQKDSHEGVAPDVSASVIVCFSQAYSLALVIFLQDMHTTTIHINDLVV